MFPQDEQSIVAVLQKRAQNHADRQSVIFLKDGERDEAALTYGELDASARQVGGWFQSQGLNAGDRALVILPNSLEFLRTFLGCLYAGVLAVPLSEPAGPHQLEAYLQNFIPTLKVSQPKVLITTAPLVQFLKTQLPDSLQSLFDNIQVISDQELLSATETSYEMPALTPSDLAYLQFTSGSTGTPKGIAISHGNILANMEQARKGLGWEEGKGTGLWLPLFHDFGLAAGVLGSLYSGGFVVLMTPAHFIRKPVRWLQAMSHYQCSYSYAPPFGYDLCVKKVTDAEKKEIDLSSMISMVYGAEPVHYEAAKGFNDTFTECGLKPTVVRPGFGMAETVIMFSASSQVEALCVDRVALESEGTLKLIDETSPADQKKYLVNLGSNMEQHEIAIMGDHQQRLPEGQVGEVLISGPSVCQGYFRNPEATEEIFHQRLQGSDKAFLRTGDLGLLWKDQLYFAGRIKDVIIIRGRNYYPQDLEYALHQIEEVRPGCVMAFSYTPDEGGERLGIAVELRKELLENPEVLEKYILPAVDRKIVDLMGQAFQLHPAVRLFLKPGTITKTSSGKIKHQQNQKTFQQSDFDGLLHRCVSDEDATTQSDKQPIAELFESVVQQKAIMDVPCVELGGDSIKLAEFFDQLQKSYPAFNIDQIEDDTTLQDLVSLLEK